MKRAEPNMEIGAADRGPAQIADKPMTRSEALAMRGSRSIDEVPAESEPSEA